MTPDTLVPTGTAEPAVLDLQLAQAPDLFTPQPTPPTRPGQAPAGPWSAGAPRTPARGQTRSRGAADLTTTPDGADESPHSDDESANAGLPGSAGEHLLQSAYETERRASRFYNDQMLDHLNEEMIEFIGRMSMAFIATADRHGECDASLRAGPVGFLQVLDSTHVVYPEYRGNGVMASLGNISENPQIGILFVDFVTELIGLHVNGRARIIEDEDLRRDHPWLASDHERGRTPERWVEVEVHEAYIHCRKHIPRMVPVNRTRAWGTDDSLKKGGDFFAAKGMPRPWSPGEPAVVALADDAMLPTGAGGE